MAQTPDEKLVQVKPETRMRSPITALVGSVLALGGTGIGAAGAANTYNKEEAHKAVPLVVSGGVMLSAGVALMLYGFWCEQPKTQIQGWRSLAVGSVLAGVGGGLSIWSSSDWSKDAAGEGDVVDLGVFVAGASALSAGIVLIVHGLWRKPLDTQKAASFSTDGLTIRF